ncbi:MAG TPA: TetR/AcrR family transcriptional regulator [Kribbellaceae bacterium]|jgi:AcrR family transcriptional regulator
MVTTTSKRTPRNSLSPELIVTTALRVMESAGADECSVRAVAKELGTGPMALYTYFRSKDDLFDAVRDHLLAQLPPPAAGGTWQDQVRDLCRNLRLLMLRHPCLARLLAGRPLSGHETAATAEGLLRVLRGAGLDPQAAARCHTTLFTFVLGATTWELQMASEQRDPDRARRLRATMESLSAADYPTVVALARELSATTGGEAQFDHGLDLLITGIEALLG